MHLVGDGLEPLVADILARGDEGDVGEPRVGTAGSGWYQAEGEEPISLEPGTAIRVPAGTSRI